MTISSAVNRVQISSGSTITITNLEAQNDTDVLVTKTDSAGSNTTLVLNTGYTINSTLTTVTLTSALSTGELATASLNVPLTQGTDYQNTSALNSETVEDALDKLTLINKQQQEELGRSVKFSIDATETDVDLPDPTGNGLKFVQLNSSASAFQYNSGTSVIDGLAKTDGNFYVGDGTTIVAESGDTARVSLGVGTTDSPTFTGLTLTGDLDFADANGINDDSDNELIRFQKTASAVNQLDITNAATGNAPTISATGDDANIDLEIEAKGTGAIVAKGTSTSAAEMRLSEDTDNGTNYMGIKAPAAVTSSTTLTLPDGDGSSGQVMQTDGSGTLSWGNKSSLADDTSPQLGGMLDVNGNAIGDGTRELITFTEDGSAVNHVNIENQATGGGPIISAAGDDANVDLDIRPKGTGNVTVGDGTDTTKEISFEVSGATTATTTTLTAAQTANRTVTLPDATDTLVGKATTDTFTNKTFDANATGNSLTNVETADIASGSKSGSDTTLITGTAGTSGDLSQWNADGDLVDGPTPPSGAIVGTTDTQTLTNKTIDTASNTITVVEADISDLGSYITDVVSDTSPQLGGQLDVNGNAIGDGTRELITFTEDGAAVNHINIENQATGGAPIISAAGDDANVDLDVRPKGTGNVTVGDGTDTTKELAFELSGATTATTTTVTASQTANRTVTLPDATDTLVGKATTDTLTNKTIDTASNTITVVEADISDLGSYITDVVSDTTPQLGGQLDVNGNAIGDGTRELITFTEDGSAVNHVNIENEATGSGPIVSAAGDDANIDLNLRGKATGNVILSDGTDTTKTLSVELSGATTSTKTTLTASQTADRTVTLPDATDTLVGKATTDTFTNKTFDANGTGNSLSNVDVADLANGTDGELITWDAAGAPATVSTGTLGHVLTSNGTGAAPTFQAAAVGSLDYELISSATASSDATISFTNLSSTYFEYILIADNVHPASDAVELWIRTSTNNGSSYDSGASDYRWQHQYVTDGASTGAFADLADAQITITENVGTATNEGVSFEVKLYNPSSTGHTKIMHRATSESGGGSEVHRVGSGVRLSAADVDAIQFQFSSGNIASGEFRLYGLRAS